MRGRTASVIGLTVVIAVVIQTTLFGRLRVVTPDLVMLIGIMLALTRIRTEAVLGVAFLSGLIMDLLGASLIGLRAVVYTTVAYIAIRTRERAEMGAGDDRPLGRPADSARSGPPASHWDVVRAGGPHRKRCG